MRPVGQAAKTLASHAGNMGSIPVRVTKKQHHRKIGGVVFLLYPKRNRMQRFAFLRSKMTSSTSSKILRKLFERSENYFLSRTGHQKTTPPKNRWCCFFVYPKRKSNATFCGFAKQNDVFDVKQNLAKVIRAKRELLSFLYGSPKNNTTEKSVVLFFRVS